MYSSLLADPKRVIVSAFANLHFQLLSTYSVLHILSLTAGVDRCFQCSADFPAHTFGTFSDLQLPVVTPECSGQPGLSRASAARNMSQGGESTDKTRAAHLRYWWKQSTSTQL